MIIEIQNTKNEMRNRIIEIIFNTDKILQCCVLPKLTPSLKKLKNKCNIQRERNEVTLVF